jgi:hypothetical protein
MALWHQVDAVDVCRRVVLDDRPSGIALGPFPLRRQRVYPISNQTLARLHHGRRLDVLPTGLYRPIHELHEFRVHHPVGCLLRALGLVHLLQRSPDAGIAPGELRDQVLPAGHERLGFVARRVDPAFLGCGRAGDKTRPVLLAFNIRSSPSS